MRALLTPSQRRVLEWMLAYPGVKLSGGGGESSMWTAAWADEAARQNMISVVGGLTALLGVTSEDVQSATRPSTLTFLNASTPRCSRSTFASLLRRGYLRRVSKHRTIRFYGYFTISAEGRRAVIADRASGIDVEIDTPQRPEQHCACGWRGHSLGGHKSSERHRLWLALELYRSETLAANAALTGQSTA